MIDSKVKKFDFLFFALIILQIFTFNFRPISQNSVVYKIFYDVIPTNRQHTGCVPKVRKAGVQVPEVIGQRRNV